MTTDHPTPPGTEADWLGLLDDARITVDLRQVLDAVKAAAQPVMDELVQQRDTAQADAQDAAERAETAQGERDEAEAEVKELRERLNALKAERNKAERAQAEVTIERDALQARIDSGCREVVRVTRHVFGRETGDAVEELLYQQLLAPQPAPPADDDTSRPDLLDGVIANGDAAPVDDGSEADNDANWPESVFPPELLNARVCFWACPDHPKGYVDWIEDVAYCREDACPNNSADNPLRRPAQEADDA